ncbi:OsmC family protein [Simiduia agarivorans]|uniref:Peroxiredoxin n=1 Tax=Simiduia agarivorans (strain DSM 21679 / JCM 13881 / BCRC 17597 / SA1) TaxID=1117647 RepID=K4KGM0_SIMAS|nr:OsmC family protein [Simiduia agarivorans]AFU98229.1 hypothetical protein M5M_05120 [Simiduia agarivorans SA1 = DSM 21679]
MSHYTATVVWSRQPDEVFTDNQYSRGHQWQFDGGVTVPASASPHIVPLPWSVEANVDPEEAFVASISSCHMLFFLSLAAKKRWCVDSYTDAAIGTMAKDAEGKIAMTQVTLRPTVTFTGDTPSREAQEQLHHKAHALCFIANSVKTLITTELQ